MVTATDGNVLERIEELRAEAQGILSEAEEYEGKAHELRERFNQRMAQMRDMADQSSGNYRIGDVATIPDTTEETSHPTTPTRRRGRPPKKNKSSKKSKTTARRGRPPKSESDKEVSNKMTLKQAVLSVLGNKKYSKGLRITEISKVIEEENLWETTSENFDRQVQNAVSSLRRDDKKVDRFKEDKTVLYRIAK